jgi:hypothetical protein
MGTLDQAVVRAALERGLLTPRQLRQALLLQRDLTGRGQAAPLLQLIGARFVTGEPQRAQLRALYYEVRGSGSSDSGSALGVSSAPCVPEDAFRRSGELADQSPDQDPSEVRRALAALTCPTLDSGHPSTQASGGSARRAGSGRLRLPSLARLEPGDRLGVYQIDGEVARGGMGVVYRARHLELGHAVALKVMLGSQASERHLARFHQEARAAARLQHPNIVSVHDVGEGSEGPYLVMDLIEGESLADRLKRDGRLPVDEAASICEQIARGLHYAHREGIYHRDVKPGNVLLTRDGLPKLTDFGLAKEVEGAERLTQTGQMLGTPAYMPPEQANGDLEAIDARSDVYSLGATFYEALTGAQPFSGRDSVFELVGAILREPAPSPRRLRADLPLDLETLCLVCLEKDPRDRFPSAEVLADELARFQDGQPILTRPLGWVPRLRRGLARRRRSLAALTVFALVLAASLVYPGARSAWEAKLAGEAADRARLAAASSADAITAEVRQALAEVEGQGDAATLQAVQAAVAGVSTASVVDAVIEEATRAEAGGRLRDDALAQAVRDASDRVPRRALLAQAAFLGAQVHTRAGDGASATQERLRAYRLDPGGLHGALAFLEVGDELERQEKTDRALGVFRSLANRAGQPEVRARAALKAGRAALTLGRPQTARPFLAGALASGHLLDDVAKEAGWLERVASALSGEASAAVQGPRTVVARCLDGCGRAEVVVADREGLHAFRLNDEGDLERLDSAPILQVNTAAAFQDPEGAWHVALTTHPGELVVVALREDQLVPELVHPIGERFEVFAGADVGGDGKADLLLYRSAPPGPVVLLRDVFGARRAQVVLRSPRSHLSGAGFLGGASPQLAVGIGAWNDFQLVVLEPRGDGFQEVLRERIGVPMGLTPFGDGELLFVTHRESAHEASFGKGGQPQARDAVWRLRRGTGGPLLEQVLAHPLAAQDEVTLSWPLDAQRLLPDVEGAICHQEERLDEGQRVPALVVTAAGRPAVRLAIPGWNARAVADVDGDGDDELILLGQKVAVWGVAAQATSGGLHLEDADRAEASPLLVGLDLLAAGQFAAAAKALDEVALAPATPHHEKVRARLEAAAAVAAQGRFSQARERCLKIAHEEPQVGRGALLRAARYAEAGADYADAVADLRRLREDHLLPEDEARVVERGLRRLTPLAALTTAVRIDAEALAGDELPLEVPTPLFVRGAPDGIRFLARHREASELRLPVLYDGSSFRLRARLWVERIEWATGFDLRLEEQVPDEGRPADVVQVGVGCHGGGNVETYARTVSLSCAANGSGASASAFLDRFDPATPVEIDLLHVAADGVFQLTVVHGAERIRRRVTHSHALNGGRYRLRLGETSPYSRGGGKYAAFRLGELTFETQPGGLRLDPSPPGEEAKLARAARILAAGGIGPAEALRAATAEVRSEPLAARGAFLAALALAAEAPDEAVAELVSLRGKGPEAFDARWRAALAGLDDDELGALARAYARWVGWDPAGLARRALDRMGAKDYAEAALALHAAGTVELSRHRPAAANAWYHCGAFQRALDSLAPLRHKDDPFVLELSAMTAYRLRRYSVALELWARLERVDAGRLKAYRSERVRAKRLRAPAPDRER